MRLESPGFTTRISLRSTGFAAFWLAVLLCALFASTPRASAAIYWTDLNAGTIGRASLDGTGVGRAFIKDPVNPWGIAANGRHVFWTDKNRETISRARLDGKGLDRNFVSIPDWWSPEPFALTLDSYHLYWTSGSSYIARSRIDGSKAQPRFLKSGSEFPHGLAVNRRHIYWSSLERSMPDTIGRALKSGKMVESDFVNTGKTGPGGMAVGGGFVYWANANTNSVARARLDGTGVKRRFIRTSTGGVVSAVAVAGGYVYWTDYIRGTIGRARLDGSGVTRNFIKVSQNRGGLRGIAVVPARRAPSGGGRG